MNEVWVPLPPPQQQTQRLCLQVWCDREKLSTQSALKKKKKQQPLFKKNNLCHKAPSLNIDCRLFGAVALTLCVCIPASSEVSHHLTGGQVTMEVLQKEQVSLIDVRGWARISQVPGLTSVTVCFVYHEQQDVTGHGHVERLKSVDCREGRQLHQCEGIPVDKGHC